MTSSNRVDCSTGRYTGEVAAGPIEAGDEVEFDRITADIENDWNRGSRCLDSQCSGGAPGHDNYRNLALNQISRERGQSIDLTFRPAVFDRNVLALNVTGFVEAATKCNDAVVIGRCGAEKAYHRHRLLMRLHRERPRRRAAEQRDERASLHSIKITRPGDCCAAEFNLAYVSPTAVAQDYLAARAACPEPGPGSRHFLSSSDACYEPRFSRRTWLSWRPL